MENCAKSTTVRDGQFNMDKKKDFGIDSIEVNHVSFDVNVSKMKDVQSDDQNKTKSMDFNSEESPFKKKKIETKSKEEILKIRESILNDLSRDVKKLQIFLNFKELFEEKWKMVTQNYSSIYVKRKKNQSHFLRRDGGNRKDIPKENPHLKNVKSTTVRDVQSMIGKTKDFGMDTIKVDNVSSFVTNVLQKMFRVSPKFSETKKSFFTFYSS
jgi:hypothetical protein